MSKDENGQLEAFLEREAVNKRLDKIAHKILVLSGKGGVGKSTVAVNIAAALALEHYKVGLLDIDIHGPSVPKLLKLEDEKFTSANGAIQPVRVEENFKAVSIGFLLDNGSTPVIWRGPRKMGVIKQFLKDVEWGNLDYLIIDSPPGTGDEPLSICQFIPDADGAIIVTTPQDLSVIDVQKAVTFCRSLNINIIGVVENMSGFICPQCGKRADIFKTGGGKKMASEMAVPFLGSIPIDPEIVSAGDEGKPYVYRKEKGIIIDVFRNIIETIK
jgi:Mrp family chromosome partitioning ATPase